MLLVRYLYKHTHVQTCNENLIPAINCDTIYTPMYCAADPLSFSASHTHCPSSCCGEVFTKWVSACGSHLPNVYVCHIILHKQYSTTSRFVTELNIGSTVCPRAIIHALARTVWLRILSIQEDVGSCQLQDMAESSEGLEGILKRDSIVCTIEHLHWCHKCTCLSFQFTSMWQRVQCAVAAKRVSSSYRRHRKQT